MNIDEPYHLNQAQLWLNNFSYISKDESGPSFTYGPLIGIIQLVINRLIGNGDISSYANNPLTFEINHLVTASIGLAACLVLLLLNRTFKNLNNFGYLASAILLSLPIWVGNSFHNMKDIPAAAGYVFVTVGCILLVNSFLKNSPDFRNIFLIFFGFLFVLGTRPALLLPVLLSFFLSLLYLKFVLHLANSILLKISFLTLIPTTISFLVFLPHFIQFPIKSFKETFYTSSNFPWNGSVLTGGKLENAVLTINYFSKWFFAQTPIIFILLFLIGLFAYFSTVFKNKKSNLFVASSLILLQFGLVPFYLFITNSPIYNGLRHIMFIYPSLAFFSALGFYYLFNHFKNKQKILLAILALGFIFPNVESVRLMPFQQIYYNPVISVLYDVASDWETDYYGITAREAFQHLPKNGNLIETSEWVWQEPAFLQERGLKTSNIEISDSDYWMVSGIYTYLDGDSRIRMLSSKAPLEALKPTCTAEYVVSRKLGFETIPLSFVQRCQNSGKLLNGYASITWSTQTEVSKDQKAFFWLTTKGDAFRITNITSQTISRNLVFDISSNPCQIPTSLRVDADKFSQSSDVPGLKADVVTVKVPIVIKPYKTSVINLIPDINNQCFLQNGDEREFNSSISNIDISD